jgi:hypothetical protein
MMKHDDKSLGPVWEAMCKEDLERYPESRKLFEKWNKNIEALCAQDEGAREIIKTAIERSGFVPKAREVKTDVAPNLRLSKGKMKERAKWIRKWAKKYIDEGRYPTSLRFQAFDNVKERQDRELAQFRESIDQDELEVIELDRLARIEGAKEYDRTHKRRTQK